MKKTIHAFLLILALTLTLSCGGCLSKRVSGCPHLPYGMPKGTPPTNDFICRDTYALSSNDDTKFADWVAYKITAQQLKCDVKTERRWRADPDIEEPETLEPSDYKGTGSVGYDRGHQAPLASFKCKDWENTNYLSNITPQKAALNQGAWRKLEDEVRDLAQQKGELFVLTGTVYERKMKPLPGANEPHQVPSGYWKIISIKGKHTAYFFDQNTPKGADYRTGLTTIAEIERKTGLDLPY